jgi:lipopolysaccharide export LptBFGC system permease protein LptF
MYFRALLMLLSVSALVSLLICANSLFVVTKTQSGRSEAEGTRRSKVTEGEAQGQKERQRDRRGGKVTEGTKQ